jgi:predicted dehydrogenase
MISKILYYITIKGSFSTLAIIPKYILMNHNNDFSRRRFISKSLLASAAGIAAIPLIKGCKAPKPDNYNYPPLLNQAPDGPMLKAGLVGCGGRGTGAAINFLEAGPNLQVTALGDLFPDKVDACRAALKEQKSVEIADENCFSGFDAYEKVIDSGVDIVLLATPPYFRPQHFEACVKAGKHVFLEKPIAVDPDGVRSVMINALRADEMKLTVVAGTIKRHQKDYLETYRKIKQGAIGNIVSANAYYNQGKLWHRNPQPDWSEMEAMVRNWVNWCWLSGDHIVEQHVHNLDTMNWFIGNHPLKACGFGARHRRTTGDQYDFFSVDYTYPDDVHVHSMCRQINGCTNNVSDLIRGTEGYSNCANTIFAPDGSIKWKFPLTPEQEQDPTYHQSLAFTQEHIDMVTAIRTNRPVNEAHQIAESTLTGIMGRMSAYSGKEISWDELMNSDLKLGPKVFVMGDVDIDKQVVIPGN